MAKSTQVDNGKQKVDRPFPRRTLEDALRIPTAIRENNGGNPWSPQEIARAIDVGAQTGGFYYITAAARDYGLTTGSSKTAEIALTPLGTRVVYPESTDQRHAALLEAFHNIELFRRVLEHYKGLNFPERQFLDNTLSQKFGLHKDTHQEFIELLERNCRFLGIGTEYPIAPKGKAKAQIETKGGQATSSEIETLTKSVADDDRPVCFVVMPFVERDERHAPGFFGEALESLIRPAAEKAGFRVRTANRRGSDVIQSTIVNELLDADLVIADLTEHNPNVLFELGLRMAEERPVALIRAKGTGRIFDVDNMLRVEDYDPCLWPSTLKIDLPRMVQHIQATWDGRVAGISYLSLLRQKPVEIA